MDQNTLKRKKAIELRLQSCGIKDYKISHLPYLDFDPETFATPYEVGCRIMILQSLTYAVHHDEHRKAIIGWLKKENIWDYVSPKERTFLENGSFDQRVLSDVSWKIEAAYVLAWALGLITDLSESCQPMSDDQYDQFETKVPRVGDELAVFLASLQYISKSNIIDENLFNELATTYFRDIYYSQMKSTSNIDKKVSFERHVALNWVRRFMDIADWDDTDTST
ncbi:DUF4272 domain-containing protein [Mucilaginibacter paludis]|uniref:DUF4272 domain-containing protein n=1 Tax=Mucilaginibacter paludis DSM 18603 TaxID=714943 RepID=H1YIT2_9SPHI|nr:DUF4272 domain-containing protein [Mucilaginibacter paludis]EHQ27627.1 hypothetical protein Mucpa_3529 [Mucilaginibacter paludis DSM 18603]